MKKIFVIIILALITVPAFSQKVYQSGAYWPQALRPGHITIQGVLIEKYVNKGFYWFTVVNGNITYKISVTKPIDFEKAKIDSAITVKECFELSSNSWKRKTSK